MANTATKLLLKQDTTVIDDIIDRFHLNEAESEFVKRSTVGNALLIAGNSRIPIYVQSSPEEHRIITTKPDEMEELVREPQGPEVEHEAGVRFDVTKPIHREVELEYEEIQTLKKMDFHECKSETLEGVREMFLVKNETDETDDHFILQELILQELKKYTDRALVHHTTLPDITFETPSGEIVAIEIIADPNLEVCIEKIEEKLNILKRYDSYFFVVTNPELKKHSEYGEVLIRTEVPNRIHKIFG